MVKIENEYGDQYIGKSSNAIYQKHYGRTIRRQGYKETKEPSPPQVAIRNRFKESHNWIKSLNHNEIQDIKQFYSILKDRNPKQWPVNWYNFAKLLYIKKPKLKIIDPISSEYQVQHINILQIQEIGSTGNIIFDTGIISDPPTGKILKTYTKTPTPQTTQVKIIIVPGLEHTFPIKITLAELQFFDNRFFDNRYFT